MTCGEAIVKLLEAYGVETIFGIPGVHNLELYRGLESSSVKHVLTRHEQGAGFMADGYARASAKPGVCFVISGPGVTNIATPMGQAFSDSIAMLVISSDAPLPSLGKGLGYLHEVTDLAAVTRPFTAFSETATCVSDVPVLMARAFALFASQRPRPVHIVVPLDVLAQELEADWFMLDKPNRKAFASPAQVASAARLCAEAKRTVIIVGGGFEHSNEASKLLIDLAERLGAAVVTTHNGKGAMPDKHPLSLGSTVSQAATQAFISQADLVLALGTELSETDCYAGHYVFNGNLIHVDIDPSKLSDTFKTNLEICSDAKQFATALLRASQAYSHNIEDLKKTVKRVRQEIIKGLAEYEKEHYAFLKLLRETLSEAAFVAADMTQIAYSAASLLELNQPNCWFYPAGYGTLGFALPAAIGAKLASPKQDAVVLIGDYGFQYTLQDLATAVELKQALVIILWNNDGLGEIERSMKQVNIKPVQVKPFNPDFIALAKAYGCDALSPNSKEEFVESLNTSFGKTKPTLIEVKQGSSWIR